MKLLLATIQLLAAAITMAAIYMAISGLSLSLCTFIALLAFFICGIAGFALCTLDEPPKHWRTGL